MESRKKLIIKISVTLVVILLILTFFSNTLHNLNVAGVVVGFDTDGVITTTYRGQGVLEIEETSVTVFSEYTGRIEFLVEEGDIVREDDPLFEFQMDRSQIIDRIAYLRNRVHALPTANRRENTREIEELQQMLLDDELTFTQYAPSSGEVNILPGPENNLQVMDGQAIMQLTKRQGSHYQLNVDFPETFVSRPGSGVRRTVSINVPVLNHSGLQGEMEQVTSVDGRLRAEFILNVSGAQGGERAEVIIEDIVSSPDSLLPNYAIREDSRGDFILIAIREENTFLGYNHYAQRMDIEIIKSGDRETTFRARGELEGPIIMQSDRPIIDGDRIRVFGEWN